MFSCEFGEIFKNIFFHRTSTVTASAVLVLVIKVIKFFPAHVLRFVELTLNFATLINSCNTKTLLNVRPLVCRPHYVRRGKKIELIFENQMVF